MGTRRVLVGLLIVLSCSIFTFGCEMPTDADKTSIWLDVPVDGITVPEGQLLKIEGHASSPNAISKVEIWINGELRYEVDNPTTQGKLTRFSQEWTPPKPGEYTIQVMALSEDGSASDPDHARVLVGEPLADIQTAPEEEQSLQEEAPDTPTPTATATPTPTPTPTSSPDVVIEFWADPGEINAGDLFTVHWHVENVKQVILGGIDQSFDGTYSDYLCENQRYTLTVIRYDGTEEKRSVDILVTGGCATPGDQSSESDSGSSEESSSGGEPPAPASDTSPPPSPNLLKPINGSDLGCVSSVMLRWEAVSDDSGIAEYQVVVQRHAGDNNWSGASGSPFTGIGGTQKENSVECGWEYRWRVRAIDGAGNTGSWSGWFTFVIPLT